jgi:hypothetical protein
MPANYKLTLEQKDSYVLAQVKGEVPPAGDAAEYLETIADHCARCRCGLILIEKFSTEPFEVWKTFAIVPKLSAVGLPHIKIAVVDRGAPLPSKKELAVMVGHERGLDVHLFTEIAEAESWLLAAEPERIH